MPRESAAQVIDSQSSQMCIPRLDGRTIMVPSVRHAHHHRAIGEAGQARATYYINLRAASQHYDRRARHPESAAASSDGSLRRHRQSGVAQPLARHPRALRRASWARAIEYAAPARAARRSSMRSARRFFDSGAARRERDAALQGRCVSIRDERQRARVRLAGAANLLARRGGSHRGRQHRRRWGSSRPRAQPGARPARQAHPACSARAARRAA